MHNQTTWTPKSDTRTARRLDGNICRGNRIGAGYRSLIDRHRLVRDCQRASARSSSVGSNREHHLSIRGAARP